MEPHDWNARSGKTLRPPIPGLRQWVRAIFNGEEQA
jgi:hypothetical protein